MTVINRQATALPSTLTPHEFGKAMAQLDLSGVPPEKRASAIMDHLARIMGQSLQNPADAALMREARLLHIRKRIGLL